MGFPFFMPAYIPGNRITIYGCHAWLEEAFRRQNGAPSFPVEFAQLGADVRFVRLEPDRAYDLVGFRVTAKRQHHTGDSYGYRYLLARAAALHQRAHPLGPPQRQRVVVRQRPHAVGVADHDDLGRRVAGDRLEDLGDLQSRRLGVSSSLSPRK